MSYVCRKLTTNLPVEALNQTIPLEAILPRPLVIGPAQDPEITWYVPESRAPSYMPISPDTYQVARQFVGENLGAYTVGGLVELAEHLSGLENGVASTQKSDYTLFCEQVNSHLSQARRAAPDLAQPQLTAARKPISSLTYRLVTVTLFPVAIGLGVYVSHLFNR